MKKSILLILAIIVLCSPAFSLPIEDNSTPAPTKPARESRMNLFADLGAASGDFSGLFAGIGFQYAFSPAFFGEILAEIYFNPMTHIVTNTAYSANFNAVYKMKVSEQAKLFFKAGFSSTSLTASYGSYSATSASQFGLNAGAGAEYAVSKKMGLRAGGTFKVIFDEGETLTFFTFNGGLYLNL